MAPTMYIVYLRFNGEIIYGQHGAEYQGSQMKFIQVIVGLVLSNWKRRYSMHYNWTINLIV